MGQKQVIPNSWYMKGKEMTFRVTPKGIKSRVNTLDVCIIDPK